ncbi:hypothetical protein [Microcoleus sp. A2-C2]|uniref:hypothetical protein n=1 Tax=Microcoleus sp. A2-C2 TaxID=2818530 RepID=UPI002FCF76B9
MILSNLCRSCAETEFIQANYSILSSISGWETGLLKICRQVVFFIRLFPQIPRSVKI